MSQRPGTVPVAKPNPPRLSQHLRELAEIEDSGIFSNYGPKNTQFEREIVEKIFRSGHSLTVCNATSGLMVGIREAIGTAPPGDLRYALMPSFTFAATAHAAIWNGLTPLLCDIDPDTWLPCARDEERLLAKYAGQIAVIVPYATFGNNLDLRRYDDLSARYGVPVVVDAAASFGSLDENGLAFGTGSKWPIVFSMHATKAFAVGEGGVIYCADPHRIRRLRAICSFGFESPRTATLPGLNAKLSEVAALTALLQLRRLPEALEKREILFTAYRRMLPEWTMQRTSGLRQSHVFASVLLPRAVAGKRGEIIASLRDRGIGASTYFSPHLAEQPYFVENSISGPLPVTTEIASRVLTLPLFDAMTTDDVQYVASNLTSTAQSFARSAQSFARTAQSFATQSAQVPAEEPDPVLDHASFSGWRRNLVRSANLASDIREERMAKFSLIIATYGRVDTVDRLFASVAMQTGSEIECILVDQNTDDRLAPLVERWRSRLDIRVIRCDPHSTSARNRGIAVSTGDIIAFPDDDCWFSSNLFSRVADFFQQQSEYDLLSIGVKDDHGTRSGNRWVQKQCEINRLNIFRTSVTYSCFFRRCPAFETLRFDEKMGSRPNVIVVGAEDTDFVISALNAGIRGFFDRNLLVFHPRNDMLSGNVRSDRAFYYGMGMGYVLRKYQMWLLWISFIAYDLVRAAFCLISGRAHPLRLCLTHARGIWKGYRATSP